MTTLADQQAALVAALVAGAPLPAGFDPRLVGIAAAALRNKRAGEVAKAWPQLAASFGPAWRDRFTAWADGRAPGGSFHDGWALARTLRASGELPPSAAWELAAVDVRFRGPERPGKRLLPAVRRAPGGAVAQLLGRVFHLDFT